VTWATSVPILVFQGLSILDLGPTYATDRRQADIRRLTSVWHHRLMPATVGADIINNNNAAFEVFSSGGKSSDILTDELLVTVHGRRCWWRAQRGWASWSCAAVVESFSCVATVCSPSTAAPLTPPRSSSRHHARFRRRGWRKSPCRAFPRVRCWPPPYRPLNSVFYRKELRPLGNDAILLDYCSCTAYA